jgi:hypothetical protein
MSSLCPNFEVAAAAGVLRIILVTNRLVNLNLDGYDAAEIHLDVDDTDDFDED